MKIYIFLNMIEKVKGYLERLFVNKMAQTQVLEQLLFFDYPFVAPRRLHILW